MGTSKRDRLPKSFRSIEAAAEFWDTHSVADYEEYLKPVRMTVRLSGRVHLLTLDPTVASELQAVSKARGLRPETVANLWLRERLQAESKRRRSSRRAA
jgi:hypothetical protein